MFLTTSWPLIHCPSLACWWLWTLTICMLYTGSARGVRLTQPLGQWLDTYEKHQFWHWCMLDNDHLVYRNTPSTTMRIALPMLQQRMMIKFSPTVPSLLNFTGPPVTPTDPTLGHIRLPITAMAAPAPPPPMTPYYSMMQIQFQSTLPQWKLPLFGSL